MAIFNEKFFNSEVFMKYVNTVPRVKQNALLKAGIFRNRPELKASLTEQVGGNYIAVPMAGLIGGNAQNYDGATDVTASGIGTFLQHMIVVGRMKAWKEKDFSEDITGKDFMEVIASQVSDYWDDVDQQTILSILKGIFGVNTNGFTTKHTLDITSAATATVGAGSLNKAIQKAAGANKNIFTVAIMHSEVATNLENLQLLEYVKGTDANGVQRDLALATWNGRTVLIDDDVPVEKQETTAGVYNITIGTKAADGDKITIGDVTLTAGGTEWSLSTDTATGNASAIATALAASEDPSVTGYTWTASSTKVVATEKTGHYGDGAPAMTVTQGESGTLAATIATGTEPVTDDVYTTYVIGQEAFDYCDCGAAVPAETYRDPKEKGGEDWLITRQRKVFAPRGFSFVMPSPAVTSPTDSQLETAANWTVVKDATGNNYYDSKAIPFVRILSKG